jgi:hypothetical protein
MGGLMTGCHLPQNPVHEAIQRDNSQAFIFPTIWALTPFRALFSGSRNFPFFLSTLAVTKVTFFCFISFRVMVSEAFLGPAWSETDFNESDFGLAGECAAEKSLDVWRFVFLDKRWPAYAYDIRVCHCWDAALLPANNGSESESRVSRAAWTSGKESLEDVLSESTRLGGAWESLSLGSTSFSEG